MNNKIIKDFFNSVALTYTHDDSIEIEELLDSLKLERFPRILDIGCGKGIISDKLLKRNKGEVIAIDLSDKMIDLAKEANPNSKVKFINIDFYEFEDEKPFDMIICFDAYPHFLDVENFVEKAASLIRKDGELIIAHDIGRSALNEHHARHAMTVSRLLKDPINEAECFEKYFKVVLANEGNNYYHIFLKRL